MVLATALLALSLAATNGPEAAPDFDAHWDFGDPPGTRAVFVALLERHRAVAREGWALELETQIARTHVLVGEFERARAILDGVERRLPAGANRIRLRYLLERGRSLNSAGDKASAKPLFVEAWRIGRELGEDALAVDAAHMVAITVAGTDEAGRWNRKGLELARGSPDPAAGNWVGSLTYNMGWEALEAGDPAAALALFEESHTHYRRAGQVQRERSLRWSVARAKRALGHDDEALAMQLALAQEHGEAGTADGFVFEELGELYLAAGDPVVARGYFAKALPLLEKIRWFVAEEPDRLERIRRLAQPDR